MSESLAEKVKSLAESATDGPITNMQALDYCDIIIDIASELSEKSALLDSALASCERLTAQVDRLQREVNTLKFGDRPRE